MLLVAELVAEDEEQAATPAMKIKHEVAATTIRTACPATPPFCLITGPDPTRLSVTNGESRKIWFDTERIVAASMNHYRTDERDHRENQCCQ